MLQPVKILTKLFQAESEVAISLVLPKLHNLKDRTLAEAVSDAPAIASFRKALQEELTSRFSSLFSEVTLPAVTSALDPRTGHLQIISNAQRDAIWKQVHVEAAHSLLVPLDSNVPRPTKMKISPRSLETPLLDVPQTMEDEQNKELFANCARSAVVVGTAGILRTLATCLDAALYTSIECGS